MRTTISLLILAMALKLVSCDKEQGNNNVVFTATDTSLLQYQYPEWYQDAKLGYWTCWGLYSIPEYGSEWYGRHMYVVERDTTMKPYTRTEKFGLRIAAHHRKTYGDPSEFGYKDFIPMFGAENFDAEEWADLFVEG